MAVPVGPLSVHHVPAVAERDRAGVGRRRHVGTGRRLVLTDHHVPVGSDVRHRVPGDDRMGVGSGVRRRDDDPGRPAGAVAERRQRDGPVVRDPLGGPGAGLDPVGGRRPPVGHDRPVRRPLASGRQEPRRRPRPPRTRRASRRRRRPRRRPRGFRPAAGGCRRTWRPAAGRSAAVTWPAADAPRIRSLPGSRPRPQQRVAPAVAASSPFRTPDGPKAVSSVAPPDGCDTAGHPTRQRRPPVRSRAAAAPRGRKRRDWRGDAGVDPHRRRIAPPAEPASVYATASGRVRWSN